MIGYRPREYVRSTSWRGNGARATIAATTIKESVRKFLLRATSYHLLPSILTRMNRQTGSASRESRGGQPTYSTETIVDTACPLDCPDSCSLAVTVSKGRVVEIDGSALNAPTAGYICAKVRKFGDRVYGDARLQYPAVRSGPKGLGRFRRVEWDEAIELVATRMLDVKERWGGEA